MTVEQLKGLHLKLTEEEHKQIRLLAAETGESMKSVILRGIQKLANSTQSAKMEKLNGERNG